MRQWVGFLPLVFGLLASYGCRQVPCPCPEAPRSAPGARASTPARDADRWLGRDTELAARAGAQARRVIAIEAVTAGDHVSAPVEVDRGKCLLLLARASETVEDVDLFAFAEDGLLLGSDESPDKTPSLMICPPHPTRVYASARVASGLGLVALGSQEVPVARAKDVGIALRARGTPGGFPTTPNDWLEADSKIANHRAELGGTWQVVRKAAVPVEERLPSRITANIDALHCLHLLVIPSKEVGNLSVSISDGEGRILGQASELGHDRASVVCSAAPTSVQVELQPQSGSGLAIVVLSSTTEPRSAALFPTALLIESAPTLPLTAEREREHSRLREAGYGPPRSLYDGTLDVERRRSLPVQLRAGCSRFTIIPGHPTSGVRAWLWSEDGELLARARSAGTAAIFTCGPAQKARLDLEATALPGPVTVELRDEPPGASPVLQTDRVAAGRLLAQLVEKGSLRSARELDRVQSVTINSTRRVKVPLLIPQGKCAQLAFALGAGTAGAELRVLTRPGTSEVAQGQGSYAALAHLCADVAELDLEVELGCTAGTGPALLGVRFSDLK